MTEKLNHYIIPVHLSDEQVERFRAEWNLHGPDVRRFVDTLVRVAGMPVPMHVDVETLAHRIIRDVAELPGRTGPDDEPDLLLVKTSELEQIICAALNEGTAG